MYLKSLPYRIPIYFHLGVLWVFLCFFFFLAWVYSPSKNKAVFVRAASSTYIYILKEFAENSP